MVATGSSVNFVKAIVTVEKVSVFTLTFKCHWLQKLCNRGAAGN